MRPTILLPFIIACFAPMAAGAGTLTTLATFPAHNDGSGPLAALVELNGKYYGTTTTGGAGGEGTIYLLDPISGTETTLYSFFGNPLESTYAPLTGYNGKLYGTTFEGGAAHDGSVFSFDPATGARAVLYSFPRSLAGPELYGGLTELGGLLYGLVTFGGANGYGYIYSIDPTTGAENTIYSFIDGTDGKYPANGLVTYNGALYGTTGSGGANQSGTLFSLDPSTAALTTLHAFDAQSSVHSSSAGLAISSGVLYGTIPVTRSNSHGTIYAFNLASAHFSVIYAFQGGASGDQPAAGLLPLNGLLYGTTELGGSAGFGTVFSIDPATGAESVLHSFAGQDGEKPLAALVQAGNVLLGTASSGEVRLISARCSPWTRRRVRR